MSTPYWGQLPGPKTVNVQGRNRRLSEDYEPTDRRYSLDGSSQPQAQSQSQTRPNRASVQTTHTQSTLSPYASPTTSTFPAQGLAPRPPTLPYGSSEYPPELLEKRQRRRSQRYEELEDSPDISLPAAPDVPRAPPVSYRHPQGNGGPPQPYTAAGPPRSRQARPPVNIDDMEPEEYYKEAGPDGRQEYPPLDRSQKALNAAAAARPRGSGSGDAQQTRRRSQGGTANGGGRPVAPIDTSTQSRKASLGAQPPQRKNITKEEKRARVEAAERRAREKAHPSAEPTQQQQQSQQQQVRFRDRGAPGDHDEARPRSMVVAGQPQAAIAAHKGPLSQNPPEEGRRYGSGTLKPGAQRADPKTVSGANSGIPQRNLSFRERAAKNDLKFPNGVEAGSPTSPAVTTPTGGISLTRSGSNKLRKEPPGDPWFSRRITAEKKYETVASRNAAMDESATLGGSAVPRSVSGSVRDKPLPPDPEPEDLRQRGIPSKAAKLIGIDLGGIQRRSTAPAQTRPVRQGADIPPRTPVASGGRDPGPELTDSAKRAEARRLDRADSDDDSSESEHHHVMTKILNRGREGLKPGEGMYQPPKYLDEWKKGTVGTLSGALLDLSEEDLPSGEKNAAWWESNGRRKNSMSSRPRKAEAFDGEYDETNAPTRFKPPLYLKCGPLLRYCGMRHEKIPTRSAKNGAVSEREIWRGSVMIVTLDADSSYDIAPTLRLFVQPIELLPPPPQEISGEQPLPAEYVDPIAGHTKLGRRGETLYVRPVEHLEEKKDLSRNETDEGLFEKSRSPPDIPTDGGHDLPGSFTSRRKRIEIDGEKVSKYKDVRGFRLHAERGYTFWRFNIEVELGEKQQRIAYRINRGPATGFWVPARGQSMHMMFYSCNGFSSSVVTDELSGPDPMWRDVLNTHQTQPFHVMLGGGDQIYNDCLMDQSKMLHEWLMMRNPLHKHNAPFTPAMQRELEGCYLERYCMWFSQGLYGLANSQIPMVNMWDDHDISDGYGSYAHHDMNSPVFSGLGAVAFKYYMLFQQQSVADETELSEPSWLLGAGPGPYIGETSRSLFMFLGSKVALLALDGRTERTEYDVVRDATWRRVMDRLYAEIKTGKTEHLLVLLGVPIAYPRLVWLENILTSRLMDPVKALGKLGMLGNKLNHIDGGVEVLDDLNDHWTARNHKKERSIIVEDLQDLAADKSVRITFLSGDVHLAAVGQFYANPKLGLPKHKDFRYMPNVISSAIVNAPPPDLMADILNKRNKVHHFDGHTDENMIPMFQTGVDGKLRNNKHLLPHRNWCSIREWTPGSTPPPTPPLSAYDRSPSPPPNRPGGGILRRLSKTRGPSYRPDAPVAKDPRPPISGGMFRSFSRRNSMDSGQQQPGMLTRTLSLTRSDFNPRNLFSRKGSERRPDDGGINGQWGEDTEDDEDYEYDNPRTPPRTQGMGLRGGGGHDEYHEGDESYFSARPPARARTMGDERLNRSQEQETPPIIRPFHRTPTGLSVKQLKKAQTFEVNLEGGLDISLNVEVNPKDPAGITVPYRLLVPRLFWDDAKEGATLQEPAPAGFKRLLSLRKKQPAPGSSQHSVQASEEQITPGSGSLRAAPAGREQGI